MQSKNFHKLPSEVFGENDSIAAWMLNSATLWFGVTIENLLNERVEVVVGGKTTSYPRYTLARLLHPEFTVFRNKPSNVDPMKGLNPWMALLGWANKPRSGIKRWQYVKPADDMKPQ